MNKFVISIFFVLFYIAFALVLCQTLHRQKRVANIDYTDEYDGNDSDMLYPPTTATPAKAIPNMSELANCLEIRCQALKHYDPVCGSDMRQYNNREELDCNIWCGANITFLRHGACVSATQG